MGDKSILAAPELLRLSPDVRLRKVIQYGDSGDYLHYETLKFLLLNDNDNNIKQAILKRIHLFSEHSDVIQLLRGLTNRINVSNAEPYYSMALSRMGIITLEEFKSRLNNVR